MPFKAYYIPNGPKNLATFFPDIDFTQVEAYYLDVLDDADEVLATTTINEMDGECCDDKVRLHFVNYLGAVDAINFKLNTDEHEAKSDSMTRSTSYPLVKTQHAINRFNVKANNTRSLAVADYLEQDMNWINELIDSPMAWREWVGIQAQDDDYIPVVLVDGKILDVKETDRFTYEINAQITDSHEKVILRN
jgi:hypothetical protein